MITEPGSADLSLIHEDFSTPESASEAPRHPVPIESKPLPSLIDPQMKIEEALEYVAKNLYDAPMLVKISHVRSMLEPHYSPAVINREVMKAIDAAKIRNRR